MRMSKGSCTEMAQSVYYYFSRGAYVGEFTRRLTGQLLMAEQNMGFRRSNSMSTSKSDRTVQTGVARGFGAGIRRPSRSRVRYELWGRTAIKSSSNSFHGDKRRRGL